MPWGDVRDMLSRNFEVDVSDETSTMDSAEKAIRASLGVYPEGDPVFEAGFRQVGDIVENVTADRLHGYRGYGEKQNKAEATAGLTEQGEFIDNPFIRVNRGGAGTPFDETLFDQSPEEGFGAESFKDYEAYPDAVKHEYRHFGVSRVKQEEEQTLNNKLNTLLSIWQGNPTYYTPLDTQLNKVFKPGYPIKSRFPYLPDALSSAFDFTMPKSYVSISDGNLYPSFDNAELIARHLDFKYGKSPTIRRELQNDLKKLYGRGQFGISSLEDLRNLISNLEGSARGLLYENDQ